MSELIENKSAELKASLEIDLAEIDITLAGIRRCCDRLSRLVELKAPMFTVRRECDMIQYRALSVLGMYETLALLKFVYKKEES